jgi:acyl-coenzyme A thioesterase PaaI-like protein
VVGFTHLVMHGPGHDQERFLGAVLRGRPASPARAVRVSANETSLPPHSETCFGCGPENRAGLQLRFGRRGDRAVVRLVPSARHERGAGVVHRGVLATMADEAFGTITSLIVDQPGVTGTLGLRFLAPADTRTELTAEAQAVGHDGRKHELRAEVRQRGRLLLVAETVFVTMPVAQLAAPTAPLPPRGSWRSAFTSPAHQAPAGDGPAVTRLVAHEDLAGWPGVLHGGVIAALFDDSISHLEPGCRLDALDVRFERPAPTGRELVVKTWRTGEHLAESTLSDDSRRLAVATAAIAPSR